MIEASVPGAYQFNSSILRFIDFTAIYYDSNEYLMFTAMHITPSLICGSRLYFYNNKRCLSFIHSGDDGDGTQTSYTMLIAHFLNNTKQINLAL